MKKWWLILTLILGLLIGGGIGAWGVKSFSQSKNSPVVSSSSVIKKDFQAPQHRQKNDRRVFLNASQNRDGNTANLAKQLFGSLAYQQVNLVDYHIPQIGQGDGDFAKVWQQLKKAQVIVIGTPVYWSNMSGYLKTFIDHLEVNDDLKGRDLYFIIQGADENQSVAINAAYGTINRVAKRFGLNFVGIAQTSAQIQKLQQKLNSKS